MRPILALLSFVLLISADAFAIGCVPFPPAPCPGKPGMIIVCGGDGKLHCVPAPPPPPPRTAGSLFPKYLMLTLVYAPPGRAGGSSGSRVEYKDGSSTGSADSSSDTFATDVKVSASAGVGGTQLGFGFKASNSSTDSTKVETKKSATTTIALSGSNIDGVDHDEDAIYLMLNPRVDLQIVGRSASWAVGHTGPAPIVQYVLVGWLKNPALFPPDVKARLDAARLTAADYAQILRIDPFAFGIPALLDPKRYRLETTFPYEPPLRPGGSGPALTFAVQNEFSRTTGLSSKESQEVEVTISLEINAGIYKATVKNENKWTWTHTTDGTATRGAIESASATVGSPAFGYTGSTLYGAYFDMLWKTFVFVPVASQATLVEGSVKFETLGPAVARTVYLYAGGNTYRTITNAEGKYRFTGNDSGAMEVEVKGFGRQPIGQGLTGTALPVDFVLPDLMSTPEVAGR